MCRSSFLFIRSLVREAVWNEHSGKPCATSFPMRVVLFHSVRLQERQREYEADIVVLLSHAG